MKYSDKELEAKQATLDARHKARKKAYANKGAIPLGKKMEGSVTMPGYGKDAILKKTRSFLRIGRMAGQVK